MILKHDTVFYFNDFTDGVSGVNRHIYNLLKQKDFVEPHILLEKEKELIFQKTYKYISKYDFDYILIPESSTNILIDICEKFDLKYIIIKKTSLDNILNYINKLKSIQKRQKDSIIKKLTLLKENNKTLKMHEFKSSQREVLSSILFEINSDIKKDNKYLFLDDSVFSGNTLNSIQNILNDNEIDYNTLIMYSFNRFEYQNKGK